MAEYICRASLPKKKDYWDDDFGAGYDKCLDDIAKIPAADVRPVVRGKWIPVGVDDMDVGMFKCSECGSEKNFFPEILRGIHADNFCSNCGADMKEES